MNQLASIAPDERLLGMKEVREIIPLDKSTIHRRMKRGDFPKNYPLGPQRRVWLRSEILAWAAQQIGQPPT